MGVHVQDSVAAHMQLLFDSNKRQQRQIKAMQQKYNLVLAEQEKRIKQLLTMFVEKRPQNFTWNIEHLDIEQMPYGSDKFRGCCNGTLQLKLKKRSNTIFLVLAYHCSRCQLRSTVLLYFVSVRGSTTCRSRARLSHSASIDLAAFKFAGQAPSSTSVPIISLDEIPAALIIGFNYNFAVGGDLPTIYSPSPKQPRLMSTP